MLTVDEKYAVLTKAMAYVKSLAINSTPNFSEKDDPPIAQLCHTLGTIIGICDTTQSILGDH
jgi:hypothetical protein